MVSSPSKLFNGVLRGGQNDGAVGLERLNCPVLPTSVRDHADPAGSDDCAQSVRRSSDDAVARTACANVDRTVSIGTRRGGACRLQTIMHVCDVENRFNTKSRGVEAPRLCGRGADPKEQVMAV